MRKNNLPTLIIGIISAICILWTGIIYASCGGSWFNSTCATTSPYNCTGSDCWIDSWLTAAKKSIGNELSSKGIAAYAQDIVIYLMGFVSVIAVIYVIYAGAQLMMGAGDEEKMKKARQIIIYVMLWIALMWLAVPIVKWTVDMVTYNWSFIPQTLAAYTESESDTFAEYKNKIKEAANSMESELLINKTVNISTIQNVKNLIQQWFERLPDYGESATINQSAKQVVDTYLDLAIKNPDSSNHIGNAISRVATFLDKVNINVITWEISANPNEWNAPLSVSFRADNIKDPSGTTPSDNNYIWWTRENGWIRRELSRGPSMSFVFTKEWTYTVFLDVISWSRNSKGKVDVLPLSISKQISVKPRLGDIVLLINGVNVSNMSTLKISPTIWKMGVILDASASRAIWNGTITETNWDFWNGNTSTNKWGPIVERQIYANQGWYVLKLSMKTNNGQTFTKEIQLLVRDPAAIIKIDKDTGHIGEEIGMSAVSYFSDSKNTEYSWQIQDENGNKAIKAGEWSTFKYKFTTVWSYIISLTAKSPNGGIDTDSKIITIESREPIITIDNVWPINSEKPNTIIFDATKSYDPDSNSRKDLTYEWRIDDEKVTLDNIENNWARWTYTFSNKWNHKVSLRVTNTYGKISTLEKQFDVTSILAVNIIVTPKVGKRDIPVTIIGQSANAEYFEWNMWDGSPIISWTDRSVQHTYKRSGTYNVTLSVNREWWSEINTINRKIYISDSESPYSIIEASNASSSIIEEKNACEENSALLINRAEPTTFNGANSVNTDGNTNGLTYTWKYLWKARTTPTISEKFNELGCFPIELTVRSTKNGWSHTTKQYIKLTNQPPEITSLTVSQDSTKKDSQKILVKVQANGALDPDGVITSYIWYYTTESDPEPQNIQITQKSDITFVLPNITEKYYFWVILEDNDGAKMNSTDSGQNPAPLIIDNANGNIHIPLITLTVPKTVINIGESLRFSVDVKTIIPGVNITNKSEYAWDFDGDGRIDEKSNTPTIDHIYTRSGDFNMKVRVTNNGVSNTKFQTIHVKNKLKADIQGYKLPDNRIYLLNASEWVYDKAHWEFWNTTSESLNTLLLDETMSSMSGRLTISYNDTDVSNLDIDLSKIESISGTGLFYQSFPKSINDTITVKNKNDTVILSMLWNDGTIYSIDTDILIDSNLDSIPDNDDDNKDDWSYMDGSLYTFKNLDSRNKREQKIRLAIKKDGAIVASKVITIILDYIIGSEEKGIDLSWSGIAELSTGDKAKLEELSKMIRELTDSDRIILMQRYNTLVENWNNPFDKAKSLIDIQEWVESGEMDASTKGKISKVIDELLIGDAQVTDEIGIAAILIRDLIPAESPNHDVLLAKLEEIESHPTLLDVNKKLGKEMLVLIENDTTIPDKYKWHIKNQLLIIINGGTPSVTTTNSGSWEETTPKSSESGIFSFISGFVKIFFIIIGSIFVIGLIAFIFYRITRKWESIGFQDFLIDSVFHGWKVSSVATNTPTPATNTIIKNESIVTPPIVTVTPTQPKIDPLVSYTPPSIPIETQTISSPSFDILKPKENTSDPLNTIPETIIENTEKTTTDSIPDWLKVPSIPTISNEIKKDENNSSIEDSSAVKNEETGSNNEKNEDIEEIKVGQNNDNAQLQTEDENIPDWIKNTSIWEKTNEGKSSLIQEKNNIVEEEKLPDWLINSLHTEENSLKDDAGLLTSSSNIEENSINTILPVQEEIEDLVTNNSLKEEIEKIQETKTPKKKKIATKNDVIPATVTNTENIPSWLK